MIVLASSSPRRGELLEQIDIQYIRHSADIDESIGKNEDPRALVERLAREKAAVVATQRADNLLVLGSDTIGLIDQQILVKPEGFQDFVVMMKAMSGRCHAVITAIAVASYCPQNQKLQLKSEIVESKVFFKVLSDDEIEHYWQTGEPQDKAGGYGIQGYAARFVSKIEGSYSAIVGLPLYETAELLNNMRYDLVSNGCTAQIN